MFKSKATPRLLALRMLSLLLLVLGGCKGSALGEKFFDGARHQDGLDTGVVYLWKRSPAEDSGNPSILSTEYLDNRVPKTALQFSNILDTRAPIRSSDFIVQYGDFNAAAPMFFTWAGTRVPWVNKTREFRALFAYYHTNRLINYVDGLIAQDYLPSDTANGSYTLENTIAWRSSVCSGGATQTSSGRSCSDLNELTGGPVLPFYVSVDNKNLASGESSLATDTGYCSMFNVDYRSNGEPYCLARDTTATWPTLWNQGSLTRMLSFYRDRDANTFNFVDDSDVIAHEIGHLLQGAVNPALLETSGGTNRQLDGIIEGMSDYFSAAYHRSNRLTRYTVNNLYPLSPESYTGELRGAERDPSNTLYFPNAYIPSAHLLGRVLSGAFNDIRQLGVHSGTGVRRLPGGACEKVVGCALADFVDRDEDPSERIPYGSVAVSEETSWDLSMALFYRAFYALRQESSSDALGITLHAFAAVVVEQCAAWATCESTFGSANVESIMKDRGLLSTRLFNPSIPATEQDVKDVNVASVKHLADFGIVGVTGNEDSAQDNITRRWGITADTELAWIPYTPGGSLQFANNDGIPSPCEVVIVFPNITNNSNLREWGEAPPALPGAGWPAYPGAIGSWIPGGNPANYVAKNRGVDIAELFYKMAATPSNFENFQHPTVGFIEPFQGADSADWKSIPYLQAGENTQQLASNASSRIYGTYQERFFDKSQNAKPVSTTVSKASLRSQVGYILRLPDEVEVKAGMTFQINYRVANTKGTYRVTEVNFVDHTDEDKPISQSSIFTQLLETQAGGADYCE